MSAITGIWDFRAIAGNASASSCDGTATLTIWQPAAVSSAICCRVEFTSAVSVVVMDCTDTGAPPPTATACLPLPTMIWRDCRRGASGAGGVWGMPRLTVIGLLASSSCAKSSCANRVGRERLPGYLQRVDDVGRDHQQCEQDDQREHPDTDRN